MSIASQQYYDQAKDDVDKLVNRVWNRPRHFTLEKMAKETGLGLHWLGKFSRGEMLGPRYHTYVVLKAYCDNNNF